jgi:hypothetical protein
MPPKRKPRRSTATKPRRALSNRVVVGNNPASKYTPLGAFVDPPTTSPREIAFHKKHSKKIIASIAAISALAVLSHRDSIRTPYYHSQQASKIMTRRLLGLKSPPQSPVNIDRLKRANEAVWEEENLLDGLNAGLNVMGKKTTAAEHTSYAAFKAAKRMDHTSYAAFKAAKRMDHTSCAAFKAAKRMDRGRDKIIREFREWV